MRFNADRLAALAGVNPNGQSNGMLNEASNRSMHDDPSLKGDDEYRFGKNQLAEDVKLDGPPDVSPEEEEAFLSQGMSEDKHGDEELDEDKHSDEELDEDKHGDEVVEIDEAMLKKEILKMRQQRNQSVAENNVRKAVRREIREMFGTEGKVYNDSSWVYGDNKPSRSAAGQVAMGALGVGFK